MADIKLFFSVQGTRGSQTGPNPENRLGDADIESPGRPVFIGFKCPVSRDIVLQEQFPLVTSCGVILSKCPSIAPGEMSCTLR
jgi:hypothetical protein